MGESDVLKGETKDQLSAWIRGTRDGGVRMTPSAAL